MSLFHYQEQPGHFKRLTEALKDTTEDFGRKLDQILGTAESPITEEQIEDLEDILIGADVGVQTTLKLTERIRESTRGQRVLTSHQVKRMIRGGLLDVLNDVPAAAVRSPQRGRPQVSFVVGVTGGGKTTTIGKLAHRFGKEGKRVLICAADT
ncbi:MAG: signal recognition particle receptor subunit alpha, partial [Acidobacteriota bacterium]